MSKGTRFLGEYITYLPLVSELSICIECQLKINRKQ